MDVLDHSVFTKNKFSLLIRLEHFPTYVTSKGNFYTRAININDTRWYISISLRKYCQTSGKYNIVTPDSSDQPETLGAHIQGEQRGVKKNCSFDVKAKFKFKHVPTAKGHNLKHKFCLISSNNYACRCGTSKLAKIKVYFIFAFLLNLN